MLNLKEQLIDILVKSNYISKEALDNLLQNQKKTNISLRKLLLNEKIISEQELLSIFSEKLYMPCLRLAKYKFDPNLFELIPEQFCRKYEIVPISRIGNTLTVAMTDPLNIFALDDVKSLTGCEIDIVLSSEEDIRIAIDSHFHKETTDIEHILEEITGGEVKAEDKISQQVRITEELELTEAIKESETPPIVKLVDLILIQALRRRSSDIHVEPEENCLRVRYRIDGNLHDILKLPKKNQNAILARLKIISNMNITESRLAQDGRFKVRLENKEVDFRVSALPTSFGQKFVLRALDKANLSIGLGKLGFSDEPLRLFKEAIAHPFGMILVTGPTGSGKSTTLYSIVNQLNTLQRSIVTIEDPVEYEIDGITQVQVRHDIGFDFAFGLRSTLRQSPDIIMVGEIRDSETADIAIKAALTGQLILSTLHTNDAASSITRLIDMGVEPFLVAASLIMTCAQRLCRRLCIKCRQAYEAPEKFLRDWGVKEKIQVYQATGCDYCSKTGYFGRIAILEVLMIDDNIRKLIIKKGSLEEIKEYAIKNKGMRILREDAFIKVKDGLTTIDEALRITTEE